MNRLRLDNMKRFFTVLLIFLIVFSFGDIVYAQSSIQIQEKNTVIAVKSDIIIYPNPVTDNKFYVKSDRLIKKVEVINILGQKIKTVNNQTDIPYNILVETGNLKKGMYMVQVTLDTGEKIINKILIK